MPLKKKKMSRMFLTKLFIYHKRNNRNKYAVVICSKAAVSINVLSPIVLLERRDQEKCLPRHKQRSVQKKRQ